MSRQAPKSSLTATTLHGASAHSNRRALYGGSAIAISLKETVSESTASTDNDVGPSFDHLWRLHWGVRGARCESAQRGGGVGSYKEPSAIGCLNTMAKRCGTRDKCAQRNHR